MAIKKIKIQSKSGKRFIKTFSDRNMYIKQTKTGVLYVTAYDAINRLYEETDIPLPVKEVTEKEEITKEE